VHVYADMKTKPWYSGIVKHIVSAHKCTKLYCVCCTSKQIPYITNAQ